MNLKRPPLDWQGSSECRRTRTGSWSRRTRSGDLSIRCATACTWLVRPACLNLHQQVVGEAQAAAQRALAHLRRAESKSVGATARVHDEMCARCGLCIQACPYGARMLWDEENRIVVDPLACRSCGLCTSACPNGATLLGAMGDRQVMEALDVALEDVLARSACAGGKS